ncbi:MAG: hypothetical protein IK018_03825 [Lachnospiraceae bacterium]|nr:hypothetical protein [Lachnospiraceae bacterium]
MRLKSINVYSDYLGDTEKTRERTGQLRADSNFLDFVFAQKLKYIDNAYLKQLNIKCSDSAQNIRVYSELSPGYPEIVIPFDFDSYSGMDEKEKESFWIKTIEKALLFLKPKMNCKDEDINNYIELLNEKMNQGSIGR